MKVKPEKLEKFLTGFENKRIVVWGDLILDEYILTSTGRVSREAPVLVTELERKEYIPGGAGNVVMNIEALGAIPIPVGFRGQDEDGEILTSILKERSITTDHLLALADYQTPKKSRILSGSENTKKQQVLRIDTLSKAAISMSHYQELEHSLLGLLKEADMLIISDYLYQSVNAELFNKIRKEVPTVKSIIDSRNNLPKFKGVDYATPNEPETKRMFTNRNLRTNEDYFNAGTELLNMIGAQGIILKRGHKGMLVFERDAHPRHIEIFGSPEIVDGTGAGDTVISVVCLALSAGADLYSAAQLANMAAGFVVMKEGAYPISLQEFHNEFK